MERKNIWRSMDADMRLAGGMYDRLHQDMEYATEITRALEPFWKSDGAMPEAGVVEPESFDALITLQKDRMKSGDVRKTNFAVTFAPPAYGKSHESNNWMVELLESATKDGGALLDLEGTFRLYDAPAEIYTLEWSDLIHEARRQGAVPQSVPFGQWSAEQTEIFNEVGIRAIDVIRSGVGDHPGIDGNALGIIAVNLPMVTATRERGIKRGNDIVKHITSSESDRVNVFALPTLTDATSQDRRLKRRMTVPHLKSSKDMQNWLKTGNISLGASSLTKEEVASYQDAVAKYLPQSFAPVEAATAINLQSNILMRDLHEEGSFPLDGHELNDILQEIELVKQGKLLTHPQMFSLQERHIKLLGNRLLPDITRSVGIADNHSLRVVNRDLRQATLHPGVLLEHNLINTIRREDPDALLVGF